MRLHDQTSQGGDGHRNIDTPTVIWSRFKATMYVCTFITSFSQILFRHAYLLLINHAGTVVLSSRMAIIFPGLLTVQPFASTLRVHSFILIECQQTQHRSLTSYSRGTAFRRSNGAGCYSHTSIYVHTYMPYLLHSRLQ